MKKYTVRKIEKRYVDYVVEANSDEEAYDIVDVDYDEDKILSIDMNEECTDEARLGVEQVIEHTDPWWDRLNETQASETHNELQIVARTERVTNSNDKLNEKIHHPN